MIDVGDVEKHDPAKRNDKRRVCIFCGRQIPKGEEYYTQWEYPYMLDQVRFFCCKRCFADIDRYLKFAKLVGEKPCGEFFADWLEEQY